MTGAFLVLAAASLPLPGIDGLGPALDRVELSPGAWAEYLVRPERGPDVRVRAQATAAGDGNGCWLEIAAVSSAGLAGAARLLLRGNSLASGLLRMEVMLAGQQPIAIPVERMRSRLAPGKADELRPLGSGRVRVAAGEFLTEVLRTRAARIWRTRKVPLWGLVKARTGTTTLELLAYGRSGAQRIFPEDGHGNGNESAKE